eukprot:9475765-Pyramimonas_sp.AAC.1
MKAQADAVGPASPDGAGQILKIHIDGMDQAKFKCPRLTAPGVHKHMLCKSCQWQCKYYARAM